MSERARQSVRGAEIAMIFQEPMISLNPVMRVGEEIEEAIRAHEPRLSRAEFSSRMIEALRLCSVLRDAAAEHSARCILV